MKGHNQETNYSNPVSIFVNGSDTKEFTYKPGKYAYNVYLRRDCCIELSLLLFANDEKQVKRILAEMLDFVSARVAEYRSNHAKDDWTSIYRSNSILNKLNLIKESLKNKKIKITKANTGQIYNIGWASNDTIF